MEEFPFISCIILAGGSGQRLLSDLPKQYLPLFDDKPICQYSVEKFSSSNKIAEIIIVCDEEYRSYFTTCHDDKPLIYAKNGKRRQDSLYNGLQKTSPLAKYICIHDAARPLLKEKTLDNFLSEAIHHNGAALANPVSSTIKECSSSKEVIRTLDRSMLWEVQTPQMVEKTALINAIEHANREKTPVTDDLSLLEILNIPTVVIPGDPCNIKITYPTDIILAKSLMQTS